MNHNVPYCYFLQNGAASLRGHFRRALLGYNWTIGEVRLRLPAATATLLCAS